MTHRNDQQPVLSFSSNGKESADIRLESSTPVTVRVQVDSGCTCQRDTNSRPGSYIDSDLGLR